MADFTFKSAGTLPTDFQYTEKLDTKPIGIKTPLSFGIERDGLFTMHFEPKDQIKDNLKNLIMTDFGERVGIYRMGANLRELVSEYTTQDAFEAEAMLRIKAAVGEYMPIIELLEFQSSLLPADQTAQGMVTVAISVTYALPSLGVQRDQVQALITVMG